MTEGELRCVIHIDNIDTYSMKETPGVKNPPEQGKKIGTKIKEGTN